MGLDWESLEQGLARTAVARAVQVIESHPDQKFYGLALYGVTPDDGEWLELPVLALSSEEALTRDLAEDRYEDQDTDEDLDLGVDIEDGQTAASDMSHDFYAPRWNPEQWHYNAIDLLDEDQVDVWEEALAAQVAEHGWAETQERFLRLVLRVNENVREQLALRGFTELVCFVADDDHAEVLLRKSLSPEQLREHFPELVKGPVA